MKITVGGRRCAISFSQMPMCVCYRQPVYVCCRILAISLMVLLPALLCYRLPVYVWYRWIPIFDVNDCQRTCMLLLTACVCLVALNACLRWYEWLTHLDVINCLLTIIRCISLCHFRKYKDRFLPVKIFDACITVLHSTYSIHSLDSLSLKT